ncbi:mannitol dehydrogenase family protein [Streptomyces melanosporofaciens]|uniref:Mannitol-1-phosphate 5-dehydrogenase n=1 Tax=Streptomyces melanosporofaciens TaxID=67327 RepID=A0A1H4Y802_STRMJ|nr:mannitol dehydrogenase family protein [Streptomyces melanosporofaciens]SED14023.1 fructuronate reductase [Streptomyces melanosporofaciens]
MSTHPPRRLSLATLPGVPAESRPPIDPRALRPRIVHLGIGAFHRAHQALYTQAAEAAHGGGWGIAGVTQRSRSVVDALRPQDGLYSFTERRPDGPATRVVGTVTEVLHAADDGARLGGLLASPEVTLVTLTVTEKGYRRDAATGGLALEDPLVRDDLEGRPAPASVAGQLAAGLRARLRAGGAPLSMVSCDNMADNGVVLRRLVREFIAATAWEDRDRLLDWITGSVAFPATVVDRIVPATTDADRRAAAGALTVADEGAVTGEPFTQWVLQDIFAADRPRWETAGVRFVADVAPYQLAKLRLLNGSHSLIAYLGLAAGCETVADVLATPWGEETVRAYCAETAQSLPPTEGLDLPAYIDGLVHRFANPAMEHRIRQIAMDGSQKIPERWLAPLRELRAAGRDTPLLATALAAWARRTRDHPLDDPRAEELRRAWDGPHAEAPRRLLRLLGAEDLADDTALVASVRAELDSGARPPR